MTKLKETSVRDASGVIDVKAARFLALPLDGSTMARIRKEPVKRQTRLNFDVAAGTSARGESSPITQVPSSPLGKGAGFAVVIDNTGRRRNGKLTDWLVPKAVGVDGGGKDKRKVRIVESEEVDKVCSGDGNGDAKDQDDVDDLGDLPESSNRKTAGFGKGKARLTAVAVHDETGSEVGADVDVISGKVEKKPVMISSDEEGEQEDPLPARKKYRRAVKIVNEDEDEDHVDTFVPLVELWGKMAGANKGSAKSKESVPVPTLSKNPAEDSKDDPNPNQEDDVEAVIDTLARKNGIYVVLDRKSQEKIHDDHDTDDDVPVSANKRRARVQKTPIELSPGDDDDVLVNSAAKRRRRSSSLRDKPPARGDDTEDEAHGEAPDEETLKSQDEEDLAEDRALAAKTLVLDSRTRQTVGPKKSAYQAKLAELRAKRSGVSLPPLKPPPKESPLFTPGSSDEDEEEEEEDGDGDNDDDIHDRPFDLDKDLDSFIIPDEPDDLIGAPDVQMPLEFTHLSHQSDKKTFQTVCEYFVFRLVDPFFDAYSSEIHKFALRTLDRKVGSYAGSVLRSSVWKKEFVDALKARPVYRSEGSGAGLWCDACGITGKEAKVRVVFEGLEYDEESFEDEDEGEEGGGRGSDAFYLGRNCEERAELSHAFQHWKKQLWEYLKQTIAGKNIDKTVLEGLGAEESKKVAENVVRELAENIDTLYIDFKRSLAKAQEFMTMQSKGKWR
ncbi:hypothetical protein RUND412_005942 [Rhizina undulata]